MTNQNQVKNIYIISDVHGCYKTLIALIDQFPNKQNSKIVFVGDLIDKGKNTYDVIEFVKNNNYDCVIGNHDEMMVLYSQYLENDRQHEDLKYWLFKCGGEATLNSYSSQEKFYEHIEYLKSLPHYIEYKDYKTLDNRYLVVSHSTVGKMWNLRNSTNKDDVEEFNEFVKWSRWKNHDNEDIFNVYGHTIFQEPLLNDYSCGIDLGCFYQNKEKLPNPRLCALEFPSMKIYTQNSLEN